MNLLALFSLPFASVQSVPHTAEAARVCVSNKVSEAYTDGWRLRGADSFMVDHGDSRYFLANLQADVEYRVLACADALAESIAVVVYNQDGRLMESSEHGGRDGELLFTPARSGAYFVGVRMWASVTAITPEEGRRGRRKQAQPPTPQAGAGLAILFQ